MSQVRAMLKEYRQRFLHSDGVTKLAASQALVEISALLGNVNDEIRKADQAYYLKFDELLSGEKMPVSRAEVRMRSSDEYMRLQEAKNEFEMAMELIRSLKYLIRALDDEMEGSANL